ncbi:MAG: chorismate mutase, partial [Candidatus Eisenbacteria bacterium]
GRVKGATGLLAATEVANAKHVELCLEKGIDVLWVGARTTGDPFQVQDIADALRGADTPVLVKNPLSPDLGLWIGAVERLHRAGVRKLAAVHRGFSVYGATGFRYLPNWGIPIELRRRLPRLPLVCDPSHMTGNREMIGPVAQMALDIEVDGLMIETHTDPDRALSDSGQQITPDALTELLDRLVVRSGTIIDGEAKVRIDRLREAISGIDSRIIDALAERMRLVDEIGVVKERHNIAVLQMDRWGELLEDHLARAEERGMSPEFIKAVFELIHAQAVQRQFRPGGAGRP